MGGNDDLFGAGTDAGGGRKGTADTGYQYDPSNVGKGFWGANPGRPAGYNDPNDPGAMSGAESAASRYREMGSIAGQRPAYQADYSGFNYGQGQAQNALGYLNTAASGAAPSAAEIAGKAAMDRSLANMTAAAGSVRGGPMAQASAYRNTQRVGAQQEAQMDAGIQAGRAAEMAQARGQLMSGALGYGANALGQTGQQQQGEDFQRALNQQDQQGYEQMGWNTQQAQLQADLARSGASQANEQFYAGQNQQKDMATGWWNFLPHSDARAKQPVVVPDGRSAGARVASDDRRSVPAWLERARHEYAYGGTAAYDKEQLAHQRGHDNFSVDDLYDRQNPYGNPGDDLARSEAASNPALDIRQGQHDNTARQGDPVDVDPYAQKAGGGEWLDQYMSQSPIVPSDEGTKTGTGTDAVYGGMTGSTMFTPRGAGRLAYSDERVKEEAVAHAREEERAKAVENVRRLTKMDPRRVNEIASGKTVAPLWAPLAAEIAAAREGERGKATENMQRMQRMDPDRLREIADGRDPRFSQWAPLAKEALREREAAGTLRSPAVREADESLRRSSPGNVLFGSGGSSPQPPQAPAGPPPGAAPPAPPPDDEQDPLYPPNELGDRGGQFTQSDERTKEDANRRMEASFYAYKDGFTPPEQGQGEPNYGPMAQSLEKNPITATTIKKDPRGMRMVDMHKLTKVHSGAIAHLQKQIDELRYGDGR